MVCKTCCDCSYVYMQHPLPRPLRTNYLRSFWWFYFHLTSNSRILRPGLSNHTVTSWLKLIKENAGKRTCMLHQYEYLWHQVYQSVTYLIYNTLWFCLRLSKIDNWFPGAPPPPTHTHYPTTHTHPTPPPTLSLSLSV